MYSTKLTSVSGYNVDNIQFSKPEVGNIPNSVPKISFKRIKIGTKHSDGTTGDLIVETPPNLFSFGLQENRELGTGNVNGYVLPICLWNKNGASEEEKEFTDVFDKIVNRCKDHLLDSKDEIERYDLDMSDLKNFNPLYWKKEKGKVVEGSGPVIYIKLIMSKKTEKISTMFINEDTNEEMSPYDIMNRYCFVKGAMKFESIFIGNKISLQLKLYEVLVTPIDMERKTLLRSNVVRRIESDSSNIFDALDGSESTKNVDSGNKSLSSLDGDVKGTSVRKSPTPSRTGSLDEESEEEEESSEESEDEEDTKNSKSEPVPVPEPVVTTTKKPPVRKARATTVKA